MKQWSRWLSAGLVVMSCDVRPRPERLFASAAGVCRSGLTGKRGHHQIRQAHRTCVQPLHGRPHARIRGMDEPATSGAPRSSARTSTTRPAGIPTAGCTRTCTRIYTGSSYAKEHETGSCATPPGNRMYIPWGCSDGTLPPVRRRRRQPRIPPRLDRRSESVPPNAAMPVSGSMTSTSNSASATATAKRKRRSTPAPASR